MSLSQQLTPASPSLPAEMRLGAVALTVADLDRSVSWYQDTVGLRVHEREAQRAALGTGDESLVVLHEDPAASPPGRHAGLFHIALLFGSRAELARAAVRVSNSRAELEGASDHGVSEALYLRDPDGNGVELYADRPRAQWPPAGSGDRVRVFTAALDLQNLMAAIDGEGPSRHAGEGLTVGHVHLHVGDIDEGLAFYRDALGLELMTTYPGAAFLATGGYHHHLAINVWQGQGAGPPPPRTAGLHSWNIVLPDAGSVGAAGERLLSAGFAAETSPGAVLTRDPWGITLRISAAP